MFFKEPANSLKPNAPKVKPSVKPPIPISPLCKDPDFKFPSAAEMRTKTEPREQKFFRKYRKIIYDKIIIAASKGNFKTEIKIEENEEDLNVLYDALTKLSKGLRQLGYLVNIGIHYTQDPFEITKIEDIYSITISWEDGNGR